MKTNLIAIRVITRNSKTWFVKERPLDFLGQIRALPIVDGLTPDANNRPLGTNVEQDFHRVEGLPLNEQVDVVPPPYDGPAAVHHDGQQSVNLQ